MYPRGAFWFEFAVLLAAALAGGVAIIPYAMRLSNASPKPKPPLPRAMLLLLSIVQTVVFFAIIVALGLLAAHPIGLGNPYFDAHIAIVGAVLGAAVGALLIAADMLFLPFFPERLLDVARSTTTWENFTASFYGGINEELVMRLFGFSALAWMLSRLWHTAAGYPTQGVLWIANIVMALIFGLGHLPATKALVGSISSVMLMRALLLNALVGLLCGWLYWTYGIAAAIIAHFSADIAYHVVGTWILKWRFRYAI